MKRLLAVITVIVMVTGIFTGCGGSGGDGQETYNLRLASSYATTHPAHAALERICDKLKEESGGAINITIYPSNQLGDYTLTYEELMRGSIDMALIGIPSEYDPKLEMNFIPYMLTRYDQMEEAFGPDSYFLSEYKKVHENLGVKLLGIYAEGFIGMGFRDLPANYADAAAQKGKQVRCPAIEVYNLIMEDMGYSATTIAYSDLYTALQTGVVDGWIGGTPQLNYTSFKDVIKYYVAYNTFVEATGFMMSLDVYNGMPEEYQKMIDEAFMEEAVHSYKVAEELDKEAMNNLKDYGVEVIELTDEQMQAYIDLAQTKTWPKLYDNIGEETLKQLVEAVK